VGGAGAEQETGPPIIGSGLGGTGQGSRAGFGSSEGDSGALAKFGPKGGGMGIGPKSKIFGHSSGVTRIAYVCDSSGSMLQKMDVLQSELQKSIQTLQPIQAFNVIFFHEVGATSPNMYFELFPQGLQVANPDNKKKVTDFIQSITPRGETYAIEAIREAFRQKPQLMFLLTDGAFEGEGSAKIIEEIKRLNADRKVHVNTILLLGKRSELDETEMKAVRTAMQQISDENGGNAVIIALDDL
jgi:hypothetical protein